MSENDFIDLSKYQKIRKVGHGTYSKVYLVKNLSTNLNFAAKISINNVDIEDEDGEDLFLKYREGKLFSMLNHPSILKFIGFPPIDFNNDPKPTIITEYATRGSLRDVIVASNKGTYQYLRNCISISIFTFE